MTGKPDVFVQRAYEGVVLFDEGGERMRLREDDEAVFFWQMRGHLIDACAGGGDCEFIVCSHVDDHGHNVVEASYDNFDSALRALLLSPPGHYMVAVRP